MPSVGGSLACSGTPTPTTRSLNNLDDYYDKNSYQLFLTNFAFIGHYQSKAILSQTILKLKKAPIAGAF
jgi:hypothetical protein